MPYRFTLRSTYFINQRLITLTLATFTLAIFSLGMVGCSSAPKPPAKPQAITLEKASFQSLPGWQKSNQEGGLRAFKNSCSKIQYIKNSAASLQNHPTLTLADLQKVCADASAWQGSARDFFETYFEVYAASFNHSRDSFFTGYYEPEMKASRSPKPGFNTPIYALPDDLITVNLGEFEQGWQGKQLWGRLENKTLKPYWARSDIHTKKLPADIIAWANDIDVFFLHIQGSGLLTLDNGQKLRVGFAGRNGRPYTAIGKPLIEQGELEASTISMQSIRSWLSQNPTRAQSIMNLNQSYIFFRGLDNAQNGDKSTGPIGAHGVALTANHSIAVDPNYWHYGLPLYISAEHPNTQSTLNQLMIAQDTGSAIKGPLRGDVFWGNGDYAAEMAGKMKSSGVTWVLLPKAR